MNELEDLVSDEHECPLCGCNRSHKMPGVKLWGGWREMRQCDHCEHEFIVKAKAKTVEIVTPSKAADYVIYKPTRCPHCGSKKTRIYCTKSGGRRHHRCHDCQMTFVSVEE